VGVPNLHFAEYGDGCHFWDRVRDWSANSYQQADVFVGRGAVRAA
jgi:hypothetical protein